MSEVLPPEEAAASAAFAAQAKIVQRMVDMRRSWIQLARELYEFDTNRHWHDLGYESFGQWMADPDVEIERAMGYTLVGIWREMVLNAGADPDVLGDIEVGKAQVVLPAVRRNLISWEEALSDCKTLGRQDLKERYRAKRIMGDALERTGPDTTTSYMAEAEPMYQTCHVCGSSYQVKGT